MAHAHEGARTYGKSDPIDALAVARAALREPDLPVARLDSPSRDLRLLVDRREDLVRERTSQVNRLRWHLHKIDPAWDPAPRSLVRFKQLDAVAARLASLGGTVAFVAQDLVNRIRELTAAINELPRRIGAQIRHRLSRTGNRQLNAAIHRIAVTQMQIHEAAKTSLERRVAMGNTKTEAFEC
jgi:transposase